MKKFRNKLLCWFSVHSRTESLSTLLPGTSYAYTQVTYGNFCLRCGKKLPPRLPAERLLVTEEP